MKLAAPITALVVVSAGCLIGAAYWSASATLREQVAERLGLVAAARQSMLLDFVGRQEERIIRLARRPRLRTLLESRAAGKLTEPEFRTEAERILREARDSVQTFQEIWIVDGSGKPVATSEGRSDEPLRSVIPRLPEPHRMGAPYLSGGRYSANISTPVKDQAGKVLGTLVVQVDANQMAGLLIDPMGLGETGEVIVGIGTGKDVRPLFPARNSINIAPHNISVMPALARGIAGQQGFMRNVDYRGVDVLTAYRPVGYGDWGLAAKMDTEEAYEPVRKLGRLMTAVGAATLLAGLMASYGVARWFTGPIRRLSDAAEAVSQGDFATRVDLDQADELGSLGTVFNRMTEELARSHASLERGIAERTRELESSRDLLDVFFTISTSMHQAPGDLEKTFDAVLRSCEGLGYHLAMLSLVDREARVLRAVRAAGTLVDIIARTVRPLDGGDVLAVAAREGRTIVVADATVDPLCDHEAAAAAEVRGLVVLPLVSGEVLGTLQVASRDPIDPAAVDLRPLETLAGQAARALAGLNQSMEIRRLNKHLEEQAHELARSEAAVREQTRIFESILTSMGEGVVVADERGTFLLFNPAAEQILGTGRTDNPPEKWSEYYHVYKPDMVTTFPTGALPLVRAMRGEEVDEVVLYIKNPRHSAGSFLSCNARPLRGENGALRGGVVVFRDITDRLRAETALKKNAEEIEDLYNNAPCGYHSIGADQFFVRMNNTELTWLGYARSEVVGKLRFTDLLTAESREAFGRHFETFLERGWVNNLEFQFVRKDGSVLPVLLNSTAIRDSSGRFLASRSTVYDMTERKRTERRAAATHATTRALAEAVSLEEAAPVVLESICENLDWDFAATWWRDLKANLLRCVSAWRRPSAGPDAFKALRQRQSTARGDGFAGSVWDSGRAAWVVDLLGDHGAGAFSDPVATGSGLRAALGVPIILKGEVLGVIEFFSREPRARDDQALVTVANLADQIGLFVERQQMRTRVIQSEKLASLGLLSAGIAHEINNPLAYVANNLVVLGRDIRGLKEIVSAFEAAVSAPGASIPPEGTEELARLAESIDLGYVKDNIERVVDSTRQGVKRVADIVQNLRGFVRLDQATEERVDLHEAILSSLEMIRGRLQRRGIGVELKFGELPPVNCEPAQLNQVFLNLLVNAMQAVESGPSHPGQIEIHTRAVGDHVEVDIEDNGCGIAAEVLPRIFDPFFTTKAVGEGTGLGLSISHGIVADHGGRLEVESTPGRGTRFRVILPTGGKIKSHERSPETLPAGRG